MANTKRRFGLTGGGAGSLDSVDGTALASGDVSLTIDSNHVIYPHYLDPSSGEAENSPLVITPNTNAGNKRWKLAAWWATLYNGLSLIANAVGFSISGGTTSKTLTVEDTSLVNQDLTTDAGPTFAHAHVTDAIADNLSTNQTASTAFAKSQDAVLARLPNQAVNMTAAASGSSGIVIADNDNIDFGTGNFTLVWRGGLPDWTPSSELPLMWKYASSLGFPLYIMGDGKFDLTFYGATGTVSRYSTAGSNFIDGTIHEIVAVIIKESVTVNGSITFYTDGVQLGNAVVITKNTIGTIANTGNLYVLGDTASRTAGTCSFAATYNRALSAAEVLDLYRNGIAFADKWGSQNSIVNETVWTGATGATPPTGWTLNTPGTFTIFDSGDGIPYNYCLKIAHNGTNTNPDIYKLFVVTPGKKYRVAAYFKHGSSSSGGTISFGSTVNGTNYANWTSLVDASWTKYSIEVTAITDTMCVRCYVVTSTSGQYDLFDEISVYEIGCTLALEPEGIQNNLWYDSSSNALNASYPATGWSLTRKMYHGQDLNPVASPTFATIKATSLTDGYIPKHTSDAVGLANSPIYTDGTNIGVGTVVPGYKFSVQTETLYGASGNIANGGVINGAASSALLFRTTPDGSGYLYSKIIGVRDTENYYQSGLAFYTESKTSGTTDTSAERMRINHLGNVGIGTTGPSYLLHVNTDSAGKPGVGGLWTVVSSEKIKKDISLADLDRCWEIVKSVPLKRFTFADGVYSDDQVRDKSNIGWIAEDVQKVFPKATNIVPFTKAEKIDDGFEEYEEQEFSVEEVEKEETYIDVVEGKAVQKTKVVKSEVKTMLFDEVVVVDENDQPVMKKVDTSVDTVADTKISTKGVIQEEKPVQYEPVTHQVPRMVKKTRPKFRQEVIEDCLDLNGGQMIAAMFGTIQKLMAIVESQQLKIDAIEKRTKG